MKYIKSEHQTRLADEHLKAIFLVDAPNLDGMLRDKRQFDKHRNFARSKYKADKISD